MKRVSIRIAKVVHCPMAMQDITVQNCADCKKLDKILGGEVWCEFERREAAKEA